MHLGSVGKGIGHLADELRLYPACGAGGAGALGFLSQCARQLGRENMIISTDQCVLNTSSGRLVSWRSVQAKRPGRQPFEIGGLHSSPYSHKRSIRTI